ncbi:MAG TPA: hypothetical protein VKA58_11315 [Propionibacteriaceae bacterium]|nr:hypothetical protein [Propionibacteriaceae bacterium]
MSDIALTHDWGSRSGRAVSGHPDARAVVEELVDAGLLDELMAKVDSGGLQLTGEGRFLPEMIKGHL